MKRARFFATLERARLLKAIGFTEEERRTQLLSFQGGFIYGWYLRRQDAKRT